MDRANNSSSSKKRTRAPATSQTPQFSSPSSSLPPPSSLSNPASKKPKPSTETTPFDLLIDEAEIFSLSSSSTAADAISIFDFPWQKDTKASYYETDSTCDLRDVFFSSLVDGCKAAIGVPGDRLSPSPAPISLPDGSWPSDRETDGVDCIWSCVLGEPLPLRWIQ